MELDKIVAMVIADMQKILPDWDKQPEAKSILVALGELQAQWQSEIAAMANKVAAKWVDAVDKNSKAEITDSLRKSLGVNQAKILDGPGMKSTVVSMGLEAANLIKTIPGELLSGVADAVAKSYMQEPLPEGRTLAQEIAFQSGHVKKRARFIAKDQTQKMHGVVTRTRQAELGDEEFTWRTMRDQRVVGTPGGKYPVGSKLHGNHFDREGKVYRWDNLPSDGGPGWPIGCRCYAEPVIDMEKLNLIEVSQPTMEAIESTAPKPTTKARPEPFPGFKVKQDSYLEKLVAQDQAKAATQAQYEAGQMGKDEYDATMLKIKKQALSLKSSLSKLKAKGIKAQAKAAPVTATTKVEAPTAKPAEKPTLVAKTKPTPVQPAEDKELLAGKKVIAEAYAYLASIPGEASKLAKLSSTKLTIMLGGLSLHLGKVSKIIAPALAGNVHVVKSALEARQAMVTQAITSASTPVPKEKAPAAETSKSLELKEKINEFLGFTALEKSDMMSLEVGKLSGWVTQANQLIKWAKPYPELAGLAAQLKDRESRIVEVWSEKTAPKKPEPAKTPAAVAPQVDLEDTLNMLMAQGKISFSQYQEALTGGKRAPEIQKALDAEAKIAKKEAELTAGADRRS